MPTPPINDFVVSGVKKFLDALNASGGTPIEQLSPGDARQVLTDAQNSVSGRPVGDREIGTHDRFRRNGAAAPRRQAGRGTSGLPVFMFFHGGGWVLGDFPTHERLVRDLVVDFGRCGGFP